MAYNRIFLKLGVFLLNFLLLDGVFGSVISGDAVEASSEDPSAAAASSESVDPFASESGQVLWAREALRLFRVEFYRCDPEARAALVCAKLDRMKFDESPTPTCWEDVLIKPGYEGDVLPTNALALSICLGDRETLSMALGCVPDVNAEPTFAWGYRQQFSLAHMALAPFFPYCEHIPERTRLLIVDCLGERGADFNTMIAGVYNNPPLACAQGMGHRWGEVSDPLRVRALMWGADPRIVGSSGPAFANDYDRKGCYRAFMGCLRAGVVPEGRISPFVMAHILTTLEGSGAE